VSGGLFLATANTTNTTNTDARAVLDHSTMVGSGGSASVTNVTNTYSADSAVLQTLAQSIPDSVVALGQAGATVLRDAGGAVVNLAQDSIKANTKAWDSTLQAGADAVDKAQALMMASMGFAADNIKAANQLTSDNVKAGNQVAQQAISAFTPTENKNADIGKYAMWAVAAVALAVLLTKGKA